MPKSGFGTSKRDLRRGVVVECAADVEQVEGVGQQRQPAIAAEVQRVGGLQVDAAFRSASAS